MRLALGLEKGEKCGICSAEFFIGQMCNLDTRELVQTAR